jgi:putative hydrolase of HD superfamily
MKPIVDLLFEARILKEIPRSGFHFLGSGKESVAEHTFLTTFIAWILSNLEPQADALKLISMCLLHDLPEARIGDLNAVQKQYVTADERRAIEDSVRHLPFGASLDDLLQEYNQKTSLEAELAHDADQLALVLELKSLADIGYKPPHDWLAQVLKRIKTEPAKQIAMQIMETRWDQWWQGNVIDR